METVELGRRIAAPARAAWRFVGDFGGSILTRGYIDRVEVRGVGIGAERVYHLAAHLGGGSVCERLEELDDVRMRIRYSMPDNGPIPWTLYEGEIRVIAAGPQACMVSICTRFLPVGEDGAVLCNLSRGNIGMYFDNLAQALAEQA
jgi:Polyketide cyclase / dehydrase and lipid transport